MKCRGSERFWEFWLAQSCISSCTRFFWLQLLAQVRVERLHFCCVLAIISWLISSCSRFPELPRAVAHIWRRGLGGIFWWSTWGQSLARGPGGVRRAGGGGPKHADHSESKRSGRRWAVLWCFQHSRSYSRLFCSLLDPDPKGSSAWKIALLGTIMFVSLLGSLSLAYYMCVWRGGRIHYNLQKDVSV